jgi:IS5 family transposase
MFKCLILQQLHNISDEELEYQINDRLSWMQFLGLGLGDTVPDRTSFWLFKQALIKHQLMEELFERFGSYLEGMGYQAKRGQMVDATIIPVPVQHNSPEEKEKLKEGEIPESWQSNPHKLSQKDLEARWTKKGDKSYYGYKNHISSDVEYGFIRRYRITAHGVTTSLE